LPSSLFSLHHVFCRPYQLDTVDSDQWARINRAQAVYYFVFLLCDVYLILSLVVLILGWMLFGMAFMVQQAVSALSPLPPAVYEVISAKERY
jgi:hypothetical protein